MSLARRRMLGLAALVAAAAAPALVACGEPARVEAAPGSGRVAAGTFEPARLVEAAALSARGFGRIRFEAQNGRELAAEVYRASTFDPASGPIWFVMHGASRDAERYVRAAAPVAERFGALALVIRFTKQAYPESSDYTLGVGTRNYAEVERAFAAVRAAVGGRQPGYYLFGHSAGAQFTHRLLTFLPAAHVLGAVAANAGWYTLPVAEDPRTNTMPYGLAGSSVEANDVRELFSKPLVILVGERDTATAETDDLVRGTPQAEAQGATRLARGEFYFATAEARAKQLGAELAWRLATVPRVGHDAGEMIPSAGFFLFDRGATPCTPSAAAAAGALVISEILADPPQDGAGDANGDGERDPEGDEFIELVNTGSTPICLAGWALGDAARAERHVFPLGRALGPGETLIVFGGGVPTGRFGGAVVQWAHDGLSLSNAGDVVTLRDARDAVALRVSWGDCAGQPCAADHWPGELGIAGSIFRRPEPRGPWRAHLASDSLRCSPGVIEAAAGRPS
jgi:hypothetical protein